MQFTPLPPVLSDAAPELIRRLGLTLFGLAALVARAFLRHPRCFGLIVPLYGQLQRAVRRFERAVTRPVAMRPTAPVRAAVRAAVVADTARARVRLPQGKAWLVRELGWEAVGYGLQLEHLLTDPAMQAALAAVPAVRRILRPICRMLGVTTLEPVVVKVPVVRKPLVRRPRVARVKPWSPGPIRDEWWPRKAG